MQDTMVSLSVDEAHRIATRACLACGASSQFAKSLADATLSAILAGNVGMGFPHFRDYLDSLKAGRIDGSAKPRFHDCKPAYVQADAGGGIAQLAFDVAFDSLVAACRNHGISILTVRNGYTAGEIGYYVRRLANESMIGLAFANAHALLAAAPGLPKTYSTNPLAFAVPLAHGKPPLLIDQASSATAFVNIARAAAQGRAIPEGWAVDKDGKATTDPHKAMDGALLPFGGYRGANIALMVEMLSAGLSGAEWSTDAGNFRSGDACPKSGLTVIAINPGDGAPFIERATDQVDVLEGLGIHVPGQRRRPQADMIEVPKPDLDAIVALAEQA